MPLLKITLSYNGTDLYGWQIQPALPTVQGHLADALLRITGETTLPQGSGRTDAGVHALAQVASVEIQAPIPAANLHRALNHALPPAIRILAVEIVDPPFHARHSARSKTYEYRLFLRHPLAENASLPGLPDRTIGRTTPDRICPPFLAPFVWDFPRRLSLYLLEQASRHILGRHDFTSFAATLRPVADLEPYTPASLLPVYPVTPPTPCRTISQASWTLASDDLLLFRITGTGFLHHMVRNLVGTFTLAGSGRLDPDALPRILAARCRSAAGPTAPAQGLFLAEVHY